MIGGREWGWGRGLWVNSSVDGGGIGECVRAREGGQMTNSFLELCLLSQTRQAPFGLASITVCA
jgi:hypothetical protein